MASMTALIVANVFGPEPDSIPIPPRGGAQLSIVVASQPHFRQTDARWRGKRVGETGESFSATGCTLCSVSMALADCGIDIPPDSLNDRLKRIDGFTREGYLRWDALRDLIGDGASLMIPANPDFDIIDRTLQGGHCIIARIRHQNGLPHWVVISGKSGYEYLIRDPLGRIEQLDTLSNYGSPILAIRIILPD